MTIVYTSHYMEEVEELCDRIAIMDAGAIVASGSLAELTAAHGPSGIEIELVGEPATLDAAASAVAVFGGTREGALVRFAQQAALAPVVTAIEAAGAQIKRVGSGRADLETIFLALTGRDLRDAS
jgi:ABC-2 type transport system ATP-binding protein